MKRERGLWEVRLAAAAQSDYDDILLWTLEHFGEQQMRVYSDVIDDALAALRNGGPLSPGVRARDDAMRLLSLHVARNKHKGRHIILFQVAPQQNVINVLRILHDSMDLKRHLAQPDDPAQDS